jgi:hypothetical protein
MKFFEMNTCFAAVVLASSLLFGASAYAATEQSFDVLQIGSHSYQNVTVTTKAKNYIFILHSTGMANIKVSELPEEIRQKLGYVIATTPKVQTNLAATWARHAVARIDTPQVKEVQEKISQVWQGAAARGNQYLPPITPRFIAVAATVALATYLFLCYCCMLICQKTGNEPGLMVWLPVLQVIPMLRAASMSRWWIIGFFVPVVNIIGHVVWCVRIVQARSKTTPLLVLLLLPVTSLFAFLYLAFSETAPRKEDQPRIEIMTLETA